MEDNEIINLYFKRDESAILYTDEKYGGFCFKIACNILSVFEDAQECVNDTYIKLWQCIPPERPQHFSAFIAKITRALSISKFRKLTAQKRNIKATLPFEELEECVCEKGKVYEEIEAEELKNIIESFLRIQKSQERDVFVCRYFYGDSISDISNRFVFSQSKVKTMLFRTRQKLREHLIKEGVFDE